MNSFQMTENNELTDPMPKAEIESLDDLLSCYLSKLIGTLLVI
jgi:hypothetical protein